MSQTFASESWESVNGNVLTPHGLIVCRVRGQSNIVAAAPEMYRLLRWAREQGVDDPGWQEHVEMLMERITENGI